MIESMEKYMCSVQVLDRPVNVRIANGMTMTARKKGTVKFRINNRVVSVTGLLVPKLVHNLLSVSKLNSLGIDVIFRSNTVVISSEKLSFEMQFSAVGNLYIASM